MVLISLALPNKHKITPLTVIAPLKGTKPAFAPLALRFMK